MSRVIVCAISSASAGGQYGAGSTFDCPSAQSAARTMTMKIGELAQLTHTAAETIRFYEREGLLREPARTQGNYRLYGDEHVRRLAFVRHCRSLDMSLAEIRALLDFQDEPRENCGVVNEVLDEHIDRVTRRIAELQHLQAELLALRRQCDGVAASCGILKGLNSVALEQAHGADRSSN